MTAIDDGSNLVLGLLAVQMELIAREDLIRATEAWVADNKQKPLGQVLVEQGALTAALRVLLDPLAREYVEAHGDGMRRSLAASGAVRAACRELERIADPDVYSTVSYLPHADPAQPDHAAGAARAAGLPTASGRFCILRPHARGGLGEVSVAFDQELRREVALKEIRPDRADDPDCRARFLLEAEVTGALEHPGIVPVYGLGCDATGRPYYAMRLIRGESLKAAIDRFHREEAQGLDAGARTLRLRQLLGHLVTVCNALAYAHDRGVLHRDIKPGNIMLGPYGETLVVDWGLAKVLSRPGPSRAAREEPLQPTSGSGSSETQSGAAIGTPAFMSPEQAAGRPDGLGPASDVYSLGATLYYLLTGKAPFVDPEPDEVLRWVQQGAFRAPRRVRPGVPPALEAICLKAMALRPEDRYASPRGLADDLEHFLADEPVVAYREPLATRLARQAKRHQVAAAVGVALMVAALLALSVHTVLIQREQALTESQRAEALAEWGRAEANLAEAFRQRDRAEANFDEARRRRAEALAEWGRAEANLAEAKRQGAEAFRQRDRAEANFHRAREVVDNYIIRVSESALPDVPGTQPLRQELLEAALKYYQGFLQQRGDDPELQAELAASYQRIAKITDAIGSKERALEAYQEARAFYERLTSGPAAAPELRRELAACLHGIGTLQMDLGHRAESLPILERARALQEDLAGGHPAVERSQSDLARTLFALGRLHAEAGRQTKGMLSFQRACEIQEGLHREDPTATPVRRDLALTLNRIGRLQAESGAWPDAIESLRRARDIRAELAREQPTVAQFQSDLALSYNNLGRLQSELDRRAEARAALEQALSIQEELARDNPAVNQYQSDLALIVNNLGRLHAESGRRTEAELALRRAFAIREKLARANPTVTSFQSDWADSFNNLGRLLTEAGQQDEAQASLRRACEIYEWLVRDDPDDPDHRSALGMARDNLGRALSKAGHLPEAVDAFREAIDHQRVALTRAPHVLPYRQLLKRHYLDLARAQRSLNHTDDAKAAEAAAAALER